MLKTHTIALCVLFAALSVATCVRADLLDCEEDAKKFLTRIVEPLPGSIGPKILDEDLMTDSNAERDVRGFFKSLGCKIKQGASKVGEQAKRLGSEIKEGAIKLGERAKDLGSELKTKFGDFKEKLSRDTASTVDMEEVELEGGALLDRRGIPANVELIYPDILKSEQMCGHGFILDALGNCKKLRK